MTTQLSLENILITGGAGYVGTVLVKKLLEQDYNVKVIDLCLYGEDVLDDVKNNPKFSLVRGDIRNRETLESELRGIDAVIHLACISNDPSFELNPELGKSINYDAFLQLVDLSVEFGVKRFIYASSSSVYGIKEEKNVTEELELQPLTDYSKYKAMCEEYLNDNKGEMTVLTIRPATVCGYSPRLRLDLTVNILTNHAINNNKITVFGGDQERPNIHILDMVALYLKSLEWDAEKINGKVYNAGYQNHSVMDIATMVKNVVGEDVDIVQTDTDDIRSYRVSSEKIKNELGFEAKHSIQDAVNDLKTAFAEGKIKNSMDDVKYYNIKMMQHINLK